MTILHTTRLRLEPFDDAHFEGLQAMNRLPEVMRYISGRPETPEETLAGIARVKARWADWGYSWWAFIHRETGRVAGAGCIQHLRAEADLPSDFALLRANPLEIGWRLHPDFWRQGLASEAAQVMAGFAFGPLQAAELLAVRDPDNLGSGRVMDGLGMVYRGLERWYGLPLATHAIQAADWYERHPV
jgi:RimJ/RimL family protein N-acetyltransferase